MKQVCGIAVKTANVISSFCGNPKDRFSRVLAQRIKRQNKPSAFT